jgi:hypothetical protein
MMVPIASQNVATAFDKIARPGDIALVQARAASRFLPLLTSEQRSVVFASWADAEQGLGAVAGVSYVGYNPEHWQQTPTSEQQNLPATIQRAATFAHGRGMKLLVAPDQRFDQQYLAQIAPYTDVLVLQGQRFQQNPQQFGNTIAGEIRIARGANPRVQIFVQVLAGRDPASAMIAAYRSIEGNFDGMAVWSTDPTLPALEEFAAQVRA